MYPSFYVVTEVNCAVRAHTRPFSEMVASHASSRQIVVGLIRLLGVVVCGAALISRFFWGLGSVTFTPSNFFAYLTIQSNLGFVAVMAFSGVMSLRGHREPLWLTATRATVLSCTVSAGVVFALLIEQANARGLPLTVPWSDLVLHFWLPALALVEWISSPGRGRAPWRTLYFVLGFTVIWGVVTLMRGAFVGWYPYFFLDPAQVGSIGEFALLSGIALATFTAIALVIVLLSRIRPLGDRFPSR